MQCAGVAQQLCFLLLLHPYFLCLDQFLPSYLSGRESYFLKQYNSGVLNNFIKVSGNRCILALKALLPIESPACIHSQAVHSIGTLNNNSSSSLLALLGHKYNTLLSSSSPCCTGTVFQCRRSVLAMQHSVLFSCSAPCNDLLVPGTHSQHLPQMKAGSARRHCCPSIQIN